MKQHKSLLTYLFLLLLVPATPAYAYLDPGSGSLIIQAVIAGLLGLVVAARVFKDKVLSIFGFKRTSSRDDDEDTESTDGNISS